MHVLLSAEVGRRELLLGNEGVVRGALEAGVGLVTGYPGTPASEIGDTFAELHAERGIHFEYSVNEKVALELAFGASLAGVRVLASMKHLGLTYAGDPLSTMPYIGVVGGMVIVSAADPGCLTSPNEQDQRHLGRMLGLPTLDPATPDEARRMTAWAFELSEACELPVLLRITTRVCHTRAPVTFGDLSPTRARGTFKKNPRRFLPTPANARALREELGRRIDKACDLLTVSPFCVSVLPKGGGRKGVIAAGAPRNVVHTVLDRLDVSVPLLELGALHPLPHELIVPFLGGLDEVLVVEELTPYLEDSLLAIAHHYGVKVEIHGKRDGQMPWPFELELDEVERRIAQFLGLTVSPPSAVEAPAVPLPPRGPVLCAGCLHRNVFFAVSNVFGEKATYVNDIGCYTLGANEPFRAGDLLLAMGSSVPMASGLARATGERVVAFLGDSTFFHSGVPGLVNAVEHQDEVVVVVLDNGVTAMTGFQPNLTSAGGSQQGRIPQVLRSLGVPAVDTVDAADLPAVVQALERAKAARGVYAVVAVGACAQWSLRTRGPSSAPAPTVHAKDCHTCGMAEAGLSCQLPTSLPVQKHRAVQRLAGPAAKEVPRTSPCSVECPLGICIPAYVGAISAGDPERALAAVRLRAALPSVCSHICHRPCESRCVRGEEGQPIAVNALKRYLTERDSKPEPPPAPPRGPKVAVVGAGPAGLAAARELVRRGYSPVLFDARARPGGMLEYVVPDYRLPRDVLRRDVAAVLGLGVGFEGGLRLGKDFRVEELKARGFEAVLLALGAQRAARADFPGARLPGVADALAFLEAPPDCRAEEVLVLGGGDVAVDVARTALRKGAARVSLVFPEQETDLAAAADTLEAARAEGVVLRSGRVVREVSDGPGRRALGVGLSLVEGFSRTPQGVRWERLEPAETLTANRLVVATGQQSDVGALGLPAGVLTPAGWLVADELGRTATPWLFAAGDIVTGPSTVTAAMAFGVRAAWAIDAFLSEGRRAVEPPAAPMPRPRREAHASRQPPLPAGRTPTEAEARAEAARCLLCGMCSNCNACVELLGCPAIDRDGSNGNRPTIREAQCASCGACISVCPNHAIRLGQGASA